MDRWNLGLQPTFGREDGRVSVGDPAALASMHRPDPGQLELERTILRVLREPAPEPAPMDLCTRILERLSLEDPGFQTEHRLDAARAGTRLGARGAAAFLVMTIVLVGLEAADLDLSARCCDLLGRWATWTYTLVHGMVTVPAVRGWFDQFGLVRATGATLTSAAGLVATSHPMLWVGLAALSVLVARTVGVRPWSRRSIGKRMIRAEWRHVTLAAVVLAWSDLHEAHAVGEPRVSQSSDRVESSQRDSTGSDAAEGATRRESNRPAPRRKTAGYDMVKVGERIHVHADEVVRGDVVALGGDVRIEGEVTGNVVVVGGDLDAGPDAQVGGQALALGGRVDASTGANIEGGVVSLSLLPSQWFRDAERGRLARAGRILGLVLRLGVFLVAAAILGAVFPQRIRRATATMGNSFLRCFGLGVLALTGGLFAVAVASVLLAITLVGIPLALLLACGTTLLLLGAWVVGTALVGERLLDSRGRGNPAPFVAAATGLVVLLVPQLLVEVVRGLTGAVPLGMALRLAYAALILTVLATGLGAVLFSRLGSESAPARAFDAASAGGATLTTSPSENPHSL